MFKKWGTDPQEEDDEDLSEEDDGELTEMSGDPDSWTPGQRASFNARKKSRLSRMSRKSRKSKRRRPSLANAFGRAIGNIRNSLYATFGRTSSRASRGKKTQQAPSGLRAMQIEASLAAAEMAVELAAVREHAHYYYFICMI